MNFFETAFDRNLFCCPQPSIHPFPPSYKHIPRIMQTPEESLANGHIDFDQVPSFGAEQEYAEEDPVLVVEEQGAPVLEQPGKVDESRRTAIYWVRVPKPPVNDDLLKGLQAEFQAQVAKLKVLNVKLGAKRVSGHAILVLRQHDLHTKRTPTHSVPFTSKAEQHGFVFPMCLR